jgi:hypothetical protein
LCALVTPRRVTGHVRDLVPHRRGHGARRRRSVHGRDARSADRLDPRCAEDANLDRKDLYRTNYEATKLAIGRALRGEPTVDELIANRTTVKHYALEDVIDY